MKQKTVWTCDVSKLREILDEGDGILAEIESANRKSYNVTDAKEIQRLCVLITSRYAQAASSLYGVIRNQEQVEELRKLEETISK